MSKQIPQHRHRRPTCVMPNCNNLTARKEKKSSNKITYQTLCSRHKSKKGLPGVQKFKMDTGCQNSKCKSQITDPAQLEFDHINGDRYNNDSSNIQILCSNCHKVKTSENGDHLTRYSDVPVGAYDEFFAIGEEEHHISLEELLAIVKVNVDNQEISDSLFRKIISATVEEI